MKEEETELSEDASVRSINSDSEGLPLQARKKCIRQLLANFLRICSYTPLSAFVITPTALYIKLE